MGRVGRERGVYFLVNIWLCSYCDCGCSFMIIFYIRFGLDRLFILQSVNHKRITKRIIKP